LAIMMAFLILFTQDKYPMFFYIFVIVLTLYCLSGVALVLAVGEEVKEVLRFFDLLSPRFYIWARSFVFDPAELELFKKIIVTSPAFDFNVLDGLLKAGYAMEDIAHLMQ